jgi:hypothetical protein
MTRKALWLLPASLAVVVASQWKDIARYVKIHQMSRGARPTGAPSAGIPPAGTTPAGIPPAGTPPAGIPPAGTPRDGAPQLGAPRDETGDSPR